MTSSQHSSRTPCPSCSSGYTGPRAAGQRGLSEIRESIKPQPLGLRFRALLTEGEPDLRIERMLG